MTTTFSLSYLLAFSRQKGKSLCNVLNCSGYSIPTRSIHITSVSLSYFVTKP